MGNIFEGVDIELLAAYLALTGDLIFAIVEIFESQEKIGKQNMLTSKNIEDLENIAGWLIVVADILAIEILQRDRAKVTAPILPAAII